MPVAIGYNAPVMAWLAKLDAKAQRWPPPALWAYTAVKATLIVIGALALGRMLLDKVGIWPYFAP